MTLPWSLHFKPAAGRFTLNQRFDPATNRAEFTVTSTATRRHEIGTVTISADLDLPAASGFARLNTGHSSGDDRIAVFGAVDPGMPEAYRTANRARVRYHSEGWIGLTCPARGFPVVVLGSLDRTRDCGIAVELDASETVLRSLTVTVDYSGERIGPGDEIPLPLFIVEGRDLDSLAAEYASAVVADVLSSDLPASPPVIAPVGVQLPASLEGAVVMVDADSRADTGDWLSESSTLAEEAARILASGQRPGLRFAPFALPVSSGAVDTSHEGARGFPDGAIHRIVDEWGFTCLDLTGLSAALSTLAGESTEATPTAAARLRAGLEMIRAAAGPGVFILAHDTPMALPAGLVDAVATAPVALGGEPARVTDGARTALLRGVYHERWWIGAIDLPEANASFSDPAMRTALTAAALSGFIPILPPGFADLPPERRAMLEALVPATGVPAQPVTAADEHGLSVWRATLPEGRFLQGTFNWSDEPRWVATEEFLRPGETAFDCWRGKLLGRGDVMLQPWDATLWQVAGDARGARLVGDSASITFAGLFHRPVSGRLQLGNELDRPRTVAIYARGEAFEAVLQPGERRWFD